MIRAREKANRISQDRHDVEPENFEKVLKDMEAPTADEDVVIFRPEMDINDFIKELRS